MFAPWRWLRTRRGQVSRIRSILLDVWNPEAVEVRFRTRVVRREESNAVRGQAFTARNNAKVNAELEYFVPDNYVKPGLCPRWHA